jgi:hypothetical protein
MAEVDGQLPLCGRFALELPMTAGFVYALPRAAI